MPLRIYRGLPLNVGTKVDFVQTFTGNPSKTQYDTADLDPTRLGSTVQFDGTQYLQANGGFTPDLTGFSLSSAPPVSQGIAIGVSTILYDELYDTDDVPGAATPRIQEVPFIIADVDTIHLYYYNEIKSAPGIAISIVDNVSAYGADLTWVQLSCSTPDAASTSLSYQATGTTLYTGPLFASGKLLSSVSAGATAISDQNASTFYEGDFLLINPGQVNQDFVQYTKYGGGTLMDITTLSNSHASGEMVYACGRPLWQKATVPLNASGGVSRNFIDLSTRLRYTRRSR